MSTVLLMVGVSAALVMAVRWPRSPEAIGSVVSFAGHSIGRSDAPVALILFTDFQCPFCASFSRDVLPYLRREYIDRGLLRITVSLLPMTRRHTYAAAAALAAQCAAAQGRFWEVHDHLFSPGAQLDSGAIDVTAREVGLNERLFGECLESPDARGDVQKAVQMAARLDIAATPTILLGTPANSDAVRIVERLVGLQSPDKLSRLIDAILVDGRSR